MNNNNNVLPLVAMIGLVDTHKYNIDQPITDYYQHKPKQTFIKPQHTKNKNKIGFGHTFQRK